MARFDGGWVKVHHESFDEILSSCGPFGVWFWIKALCFAEIETTERWLGSVKVVIRPGQLLVDLDRFAAGFTNSDAEKLAKDLRQLKSMGYIDYQNSGSYLFVKIFDPHKCIPELPQDLPDQEFQLITKPREKKQRERDPFFRSKKWMELRYRVLRDRGAKCALCGSTRADGVAIHVDHVKPRSKFPALALEYDNLQVLCETCNFGKGNWDISDFRTVPEVMHG